MPIIHDRAWVTVKSRAATRSAETAGNSNKKGSLSYQRHSWRMNLFFPRLTQQLWRHRWLLPARQSRGAPPAARLEIIGRRRRQWRSLHWATALTARTTLVVSSATINKQTNKQTINAATSEFILFQLKRKQTTECVRCRERRKHLQHWNSLFNLLLTLIESNYGGYSG